ncbi:MAG: ribonuclease HII [Sphingobacteriales bacterium]|nr:MAG: ribonuclease HII [Sphingobacteriales bacterium]TAF80552.1 MAG: ribonuclease HII [Sphingobacteriales bacterium]
MLLSFYQNKFIEAGCDEAGRGCLAGPVFAAAVILPKNFYHPLLSDSKQIKEKDRFLLRTEIQRQAIAYAIAQVSHQEIDEINILNASFLAMHRALDGLSVKPQFIIVDGNKFTSYQNLSHQCIVKGDSKYFSIAAASILAKTYRDEYMQQLYLQYPIYNWQKNKGYPTLKHRKAIRQHGLSPYHRTTFKVQ